jgi:hypothetical protein
VRWAGEDGVRELSVYTDLGMSCSLDVVSLISRSGGSIRGHAGLAEVSEIT